MLRYSTPYKINKEMISIDGSAGEGGGQILRTAVSLSAVTDTPVHVKNIRAGRANSGIRPQHLHAIEAVRKLCEGRVDGLSVGSSELTFFPGKIVGGKMSINVGTAGSITLVLQALMVPAAFAEKEVNVTVTGGTDVAWSPSVDYLQHVTLPLLQKFGYKGEIRLLGRGYYPVGGGCVKLTVEPARMRRIELLSPGRLLKIHGVSHAHRTLSKAKVAERQMKTARHFLYNRFPDAEIRVLEEYNDAACPGSGVTVWAQTENTILGADALGERGKRAEDVGREAAERLAIALGSDSALDAHMCDQIIPYLALAGGVVRTDDISEHARTNIEVVKRFGYDVRIKGNVITARGGC